MDGEIKKEIDAATAAAKGDKEVEMVELTTDIYSANIEPLIRGANPVTTFKHSSLNKAVNLK